MIFLDKLVTSRLDCEEDELLIGVGECHTLMRCSLLLL